MSVAHITPKRAAQPSKIGNWRFYSETNPEAGTPLRIALEPHRDLGSVCQIEVSRRPKRDHAHLSLCVQGLGRVSPQLTSHQLRRLASDLLDAADDIDLHPASKLSTAEVQP